MLLGIAMLLTDCSDDDETPTSGDAIKGSGTMMSDSVTVAPFNAVRLSATGEINISPGTTHSVYMTVDHNIFQYITTTVSGGELVIGVQPGVQLIDYDLTVNVTVTDVESLTADGVGVIAGSAQFVVDTLNLSVSNVGSIDLHLDAGRINTFVAGVGYVALAGTAGYHTCSISSGAAGSLSAFNLLADTSVVVHSGVGKAEVNVSDSLDVTILGSGSVFYKGDPIITEDISGTGQLIDAN
jgi:hypothetical protein